MSEPITFPAIPPKTASAEPMDDDHVDRRSGRDRRAESGHSPALGDPRFWVSICAILLTLCLAVFGVIWSQLARIDANLQAYTLKTTQNETEIAQLRRDVARLESEGQMKEARIVVLEKQGTRIEERLRLDGQTGR